MPGFTVLYFVPTDPIRFQPCLPRSAPAASILVQSCTSNLLQFAVKRPPTRITRLPIGATSGAHPPYPDGKPSPAVEEVKHEIYTWRALE